MRTPAASLLAAMLAAPLLSAQAPTRTVALDLWAQDKVAFGIFVPNEAPPPKPVPGAPRGSMPPAVYTKAGGEKLAANPLYDFLFLNLEGGFEVGAVRAIGEGLRAGSAAPRKTLLVRIPPIARDGADVTRTRVKEALSAGADGVTIPHVETVEEAKLAASFFTDAGARVWTRANPAGSSLAMIMIEDPGALAQAARFADVPGISILACGIGSLTQALGGDRAKAEAGNQAILAETKRARLVNMLTTTPADVERRVKEGFLALIAQGPQADEAISKGRAAAGR